MQHRLSLMITYILYDNIIIFLKEKFSFLFFASLTLVYNINMIHMINIMHIIHIIHIIQVFVSITDINSDIYTNIHDTQCVCIFLFIIFWQATKFFIFMFDVIKTSQNMDYIIFYAQTTVVPTHTHMKLMFLVSFKANSAIH